MQSGDEPCIMKLIRKPKIVGRSARNKKYTRSPWLSTMLLPFELELQEIFESYLTAEHKGFLSLLRVIELFLESFP